MKIDAREAAKRALEASRDDLLETAQRWSSGPISAAQLRREDHPYARRHGAPRRDPGLINRQSDGGFADQWEVGPVQGTKDGATLTATNAAPQAAYLEKGTRFMFARPLPERVEAELRPRVEARLRAALERELRR